MGSLLSKKDILEKSKPKITRVYVEAFDGDILIRSLSAQKVLKLQDNLIDGKANANYFNNLISLSIVDENNELVYTFDEASELDSKPFNEIILAISEANGMNPDAIAKAKEELQKNL
jgi:hypothetical protein